MTNESYICKFIAENQDWERRLTDEYDLKIQHDDVKNNIVIFNYGIGSDFSLPIVQEARGIIIDLTGPDVMCWPFRKFGNWNESYADSIDWNYAVARQKIDGSLIKLFYNYYVGKWQWATNGTIDAKTANVPNSSYNFFELIQYADNYGDIEFDNLNAEYTYLFELVSPINKIVVSYPKTHLYHIGTRNSTTGKELNTSIGVEQPGEFKVFDLDSVIDHVNKINPDDTVFEEGYVVVDRNFNRVKVKSPKYLIVHSQMNNHITTKKRIVNDIFLGKQAPTQDSRIYVKYKFYEYKIAELRMKLDILLGYARALYEEVSQDRYAVYEAMKDYPLVSLVMQGLENDLGAIALLEKKYFSQRESFIRLLPDYDVNYDDIIKGVV